jgi:hypothetical protein
VINGTKSGGSISESLLSEEKKESIIQTEPSSGPAVFSNVSNVEYLQHVSQKALQFLPRHFNAGYGRSAQSSSHALSQNVTI